MNVYDTSIDIEAIKGTNTILDALLNSFQKQGKQIDIKLLDPIKGVSSIDLSIETYIYAYNVNSGGSMGESSYYTGFINSSLFSVLISSFYSFSLEDIEAAFSTELRKMLFLIIQIR